LPRTWLANPGNAWRVTRHKAPLPMRDHEYVDHLTPIVLLALNTGLRRGELFSLQWKDVNLKTESTSNGVSANG
jgi:integrase